MYLNYNHDRHQLKSQYVIDVKIKAVRIQNSSMKEKPRGSRFIYISKVKKRSKRMIIVIVVVFSVLSHSLNPPAVKSMGLILPPQTQIARVVQSSESEKLDKIKIVPTVSPRLDKIFMLSSMKMTPISINGHYCYVNEQVLKKLRGGTLSPYLAVFAIGIVVSLMFQISDVEAFSSVLQQLGQWNAPQPHYGYGPPSPSGICSSSSTQIAAIPTQAQQFNDLTKWERRNLPDPQGRDRSINVDGSPRLDLRFQQVKYKTPKHGKDHGLPVGNNGKTANNEANAIALRDSLVDMANRKNVIWYTDGQYQGGTDRGCDCVNLFDPDTNIIAVYKKEKDGNNLFLTTCTLNENEAAHLESTNGNFLTDNNLQQQNWVSGGMGITPISPIDEKSSPGFTPKSSFESDVMGITPLDKSQFNNP